MNDISFSDPQLLPYCQFLTIGDNDSVRFIITTFAVCYTYLFCEPC